ncbi:MAG: tetratricopeptide repeat protein, partial [Candidatus Zixiibacteriota bacterium]
PDEPNPYDSRGDLYAYNGKLDEAIASYRKALEIGPDFLTSIRNLGNMYLFKGDYAKAESLYQVLASFPNKNTRANGRLHLAKIPLRQGKFQEALRILNVGIETDLMELGEGEPALTKHFMKMVTSSLHGSASDAIEAVKKVMEIAAEIGTTG